MEMENYVGITAFVCHSGSRRPLVSDEQHYINAQRLFKNKGTNQLSTELS
jgi:hypothetical protein